MSLVCRGPHLTPGLELAKLAALPKDVTDVARAVAAKLTELEDNSKSNPRIEPDTGRNCGYANARAQRRKIIMEVSLSVVSSRQLRGKLLQVAQAHQDEKSTLEYLRKIQQDVVQSLQEAMDVEQG